MVDAINIGRPSDVYDTHRRTKLTAPEMISHWLLLKKRKYRSLSHPLGDLRVTYHSIYGSLESPWSTLYSLHLDFFRYLLLLRRYEQKSVEVCVFRRGGLLWAQIAEGRGHHPPTTVGVIRLEWLPFRVVSKYPQSIVLFCHNTRIWQTDRQNCDSNTVHCITCSRMVKMENGKVIEQIFSHLAIFMTDDRQSETTTPVLSEPICRGPSSCIPQRTHIT